MSRSSSWSSVQEDALITCRCKIPAKVETSRTSKNPGRKFYCCQYGDCQFFLWVDAVQNALNVVSNVRFAEFADMCLARVAELEENFSVLENKMKELEDMKISCLKKLFWMRLLVVVLITLIFRSLL
ncbi:uncharacterized protein LOC131005446 [Salvia miltiorrhiza]|uniref:uncharacterized protein LOC131005446 n=1 Tax=Salvia miltiorrhiza TaxID=226208 RepID=UPI0025AD1DF5|nr:uncharacterized protein LOC131005446 [Salvia miltiorrhiza]